MVDTDLGGCHVRGKNGNSVMAGVTFVNESHCHSYSKTIKAICLGTHHTEYYGLADLGNLDVSLRFANKPIRDVIWDRGSSNDYMDCLCSPSETCCLKCLFRYQWWQIISRL